MATYFTFGNYANVMWGYFYYTVVFAYIFCLALIDKKHNEDKLVSVLLAGSLWILYLIRPLFLNIPGFYEWVRFTYGCLIGILAVLYLSYIIIYWIKKTYFQ